MKRVLSILTALCLLLTVGSTVNSGQKTLDTDSAAADVTLHSLAGKRIGVTSGSLCDQYALKQWPDADVMYYDGAPNLVVALQQGKVDAFLMAVPLARLITQNTAGLMSVKEPVSVDQYGFAFQKDDEGDRLRDEFNAFLRSALADGLIDSLDALWFGVDESKKVLEAAAALPAVNGTIRFASTMEAAPFNYLSNGQPVGLEIDLITRFCREKGYGLEINTSSFSALIPGLVSNYYDVVASSIAITQERAQSVHFSEPFYIGGVVVVVSDDAKKSNKVSLTDPNTARIGSLTGTNCEILTVDSYPNADYKSFNDINDMMLALSSGKLDYCSILQIDAVNYMRNDRGYHISPYKLAENNSCIAIAKGNKELVEKINALLDTYEENGTLARLEKNWIRPDGSPYVVDKVPKHTEGPELRLAFCSGLAPSCFVMNGEATGMDIELAYRLAYDLGYRLVLSDMTFSALIAAVESGRADMAISGIAVTAECAEKVDFTRSYYNTPIVLVYYYQETLLTKDNAFTSLVSSFRKNFVVESRWKMLVSGIGITLLLSVCSGILGIFIGSVFCLFRMSRYRILGRTTIVVTRILQGTPMVVLLMILYYVVLNKTGLDGVSVSIIAFGLNFGAHGSEIMLSGIMAVDNGQREAALAIGFTPIQTFIKIVFPQAARHFLPVLKGEYISLVKITSIVGYVAVQDLTKVSDIIRSRTYEAFFPLIVTAIIYFVLSFGLSSLLKLIEIRIDPKHRPRTLKGVKL